jgi:hypothetical protein
MHRQFFSRHLVHLSLSVRACPFLTGADETEFDSLEEDMEIGATAPSDPPLCSDYRSNGVFARVGFSPMCIKAGGISRGAGFAPANQRQCELASQGRGCELSADRRVLFPRCPGGYHAMGSLCTKNCPMGWRDSGKTCNLPR